MVACVQMISPRKALSYQFGQSPYMSICAWVRNTKWICEGGTGHFSMGSTESSALGQPAVDQNVEARMPEQMARAGHGSFRAQMDNFKA